MKTAVKSLPLLVRSYLTLPNLDRGELDGALVRVGKTDDQNIAFAQMRGGFLKIFETANRLAIGFEDYVADREARGGGGPSRVYLSNDHAARVPCGYLTDAQIAQGLGSVFAHGESEQKVAVLSARLPSFIGRQSNFGRVSGDVDWALLQRRIKLHRLSATHDRDFNPLMRRRVGGACEEIVRLSDRTAVEMSDHVVRSNARPLRRKVVRDVGDDDSLKIAQPESLAEFRRQADGGQPEIAARDIALSAQLRDDAFDHVARHGEADAAAVAADHSVDADHFAALIKERAAGVAAVYRGVGLNEILERLGLVNLPAQRGDDPRRNRTLVFERIADGDHGVAHAERVGIAQLKLRQVVP